MHRLKPEVQSALKELNFTSLTEVQQATLEPALAGKDLIVQSYTGTGKTAAFVLPILNTITEVHYAQALILTPTRELAIQVGNDARKLAKNLPIRIAVAYGGTGLENQIKLLRGGAQLIVGTPGRLLDLIERRELKLGQLKVLVLDEADVMLDMGFQRDVERIMSYTPKTRQTMMFCVDLPGEIKSLANRHMRDPQRINLVKEEKTVHTVEQWAYPVHSSKKLSFLIHLLKEIKPTRSIIFCRTKYSTRKLARQLQQVGFQAQELHGNLTQSRRDNIMRDFKAGLIDLLIATDVAARGIHVNQISHVFNFELPHDIKYYLHRIGRTGRMNAVGDAISLVSRDEEQVLRQIEQLIGKAIQRKEVPEQFKSNLPPEQQREARKPHGFHSYSRGRRWSAK